MILYFIALRSVLYLILPLRVRRKPLNRLIGRLFYFPAFLLPVRWCRFQKLEANGMFTNKIADICSFNLSMERLFPKMPIFARVYISCVQTY